MDKRATDRPKLGQLAVDRMDEPIDRLGVETLSGLGIPLLPKAFEIHTQRLNWVAFGVLCAQSTGPQDNFLLYVGRRSGDTTNLDEKRGWNTVAKPFFCSHG